MRSRRLVSLVIPALNEAENLGRLHAQIVGALDAEPVDFEILFIDDGSTDHSLEIARELNAADSRVRMLSFSRNFGTQMGILAGLEHARGDAVVVMDADLQHPPSLIRTMLARWREGYEVVYTVRQQNHDTGPLRNLTNGLFAAFYNRLAKTQIDPRGSDFRLLDRKVVTALTAMRERRRFFRGLATWVGFRQIGISYTADRRASGATKYNLRKLISLAVDAITSFSTVPLRWCAWVGFLAAIGVLPYALWAIYQRLFTDAYVPGWSAIIVSILFLGGVQLVSLGVLGEYVGRIYEEVKGRPHYVIREVVGTVATVDDAGTNRNHVAPNHAAPAGETVEEHHH